MERGYKLLVASHTKRLWPPLHSTLLPIPNDAHLHKNYSFRNCHHKSTGSPVTATNMQLVIYTRYLSAKAELPCQKSGESCTTMTVGKIIQSSTVADIEGYYIIIIPQWSCQKCAFPCSKADQMIHNTSLHLPPGQFSDSSGHLRYSVRDQSSAVYHKISHTSWTFLSGVINFGWR